MNYNLDIRKKIIDSLTPLLGAAIIKADNVDFKLPTNSHWYEFIFVPNETEVASLGDNGQNYTDGFFQININYPPNKGTSNQDLLISQIYAEFKIGRIFESNDVVTRITAFKASQGFENKNYWTIPVTIYWSSFSNR